MPSSKGTIRCPVSFANSFTLRFTSCLTLTNRVNPNAKICYCLDVHVYFLLVRICNCNIHVNWKHVFIYPHFAIELDILSGGTVLVTHCFMYIGKFSSPKHTLLLWYLWLLLLWFICGVSLFSCHFPDLCCLFAEADCWKVGHWGDTLPSVCCLPTVIVRLQYRTYICRPQFVFKGSTDLRLIL